MKNFLRWNRRIFERIARNVIYRTKYRANTRYPGSKRDKERTHLLTENSMVHIRTSHSAMNEILCNRGFVYNYVHVCNSVPSILNQSTTLVTELKTGIMMRHISQMCAAFYLYAVIEKIIRKLSHSGYAIRISYFNIEINRGYSNCVQHTVSLAR